MSGSQPAVLLATLVSSPTQGAVPAPLRQTVLRGAVAVAAGALLTSVVKALIAELVEGVCATMMTSKLRLAVLLSLVLGYSGLDEGCLQVRAEKPAAEQPKAAAENPPVAQDWPAVDMLRVDQYGDPLPPGAVRRFGTVRLRHAGPVAAVAYSPDGKTLASASHDQTVRLWDAAAGKEFRQFQGHQSGVWSVAYAPDGKTLASASGDKTVRLWDAATGKELRQFQGYQSAVLSVAYSPNGKTLASGSYDGTWRLWEIATGKERLVQAGQAGAVHSVCWSQNGRLLASAHANTTVLLWDVLGIPGPPAANLEPPSAKALEQAWTDLARDDAARAFQSIRRLAAHPAQAVPFLQERLKPAAPLDPKRLAQLIADLEGNAFPARQKATEELELLWNLAVPALEKSLAANPALETRTRIERLLEQANRMPPPEVLRSLRALEALEHASTTEARQLLGKLAQGAAGHPLTEEARSAVQRLARR